MRGTFQACRAPHALDLSACRDEGIAPESVGVGKIGSTPRSWQTGVACDVRYKVVDINGSSVSSTALGIAAPHEAA